MKKSIGVIVLAATLAITLSGCTFGLSAPDAKPAEKPQTKSEPQTKATDDTDTKAATVTECTGGEPILIDEDDVDVEYTGVCGDVSITGDSVSASFAQVGNVSVTGEGSVASFDGSTLDVVVNGQSNMLFGNAMGAITVGGTFNSVDASVATAIAVSGSNNSISWRSGPADGVDTGTGNAFTGPAR